MAASEEYVRLLQMLGQHLVARRRPTIGRGLAMSGRRNPLASTDTVDLSVTATLPQTDDDADVADQVASDIASAVSSGAFDSALGAAALLSDGKLQIM